MKNLVIWIGLNCTKVQKFKIYLSTGILPYIHGEKNYTSKYL